MRRSIYWSLRRFFGDWHLNGVFGWQKFGIVAWAQMVSMREIPSYE